MGRDAVTAWERSGSTASVPRRRSLAARVVRGALVSLATLLGLVLLAELLARACMAGPVMVNDVLQADDELGFRNLHVDRTLRDARGSFPFRTNAFGFRGPDLPTEPAPAGVRRLLLVGDSFVHAWMVREEEWMGTAAREALAEAGRKTEVHSLSTQDWGTAQELLALRRYGDRVRPDHVVLVAYPTNDLINNEIRLAGRSRVSANDYFRPYLVPEGDDLVRRHVLPARAFLRHSTLFRLLERRWTATRSADEIRALIAREPSLTADERIRQGLVPEQHFEIFREPVPGDDWDSAWRTTEALVLAMRDEAARLGADFVVAVIPNLQQVVATVNTKSYDARLAAARREPLARVLDMDLPDRRLEELFHRAGIAHVQMLDELRRIARETDSTVYVSDGHLGGVGQVALGRAIAARLAPGAEDLCARGGEDPVDLLAKPGEPPHELDLLADDHWPFFGFGWRKWTPPAASGAEGGWGTRASGQLAARAGAYTLEGVLTDQCAFPASVIVRGVNEREVVARARVAAPGPFRLAFVLEPTDFRPGTSRELVQLSIEGASAADAGPPRLELRRLRIDPLPAGSERPPPESEARASGLSPTRELARRSVDVVLRRAWEALARAL